MNAANDTVNLVVRYVIAIELDGWTDSRLFTPDPDGDSAESQGRELAATWWPGAHGKGASVTVRPFVAMRRAPVACFRR